MSWTDRRIGGPTDGAKKRVVESCARDKRKNKNRVVHNNLSQCQSFFKLEYMHDRKIQLNPALTDFKGPTNCIHYKLNSVIAIIGNEKKQIEGTVNLHPS